MEYSYSCVNSVAITCNWPEKNHVLDRTLLHCIGHVPDRQLQELIARLRDQHGHPPHTNISANFQWIPSPPPSFCTSFPAAYLRYLGKRAVVPESCHKSLLRSSGNPATVLGLSIPPLYEYPMHNSQACPPSCLLCRRRRPLLFTICGRSHPHPYSHFSFPVLYGPCHFPVLHSPHHCTHHPPDDHHLWLHIYGVHSDASVPSQQSVPVSIICSHLGCYTENSFSLGFRVPPEREDRGMQEASVHECHGSWTGSVPLSLRCLVMCYITVGTFTWRGLSSTAALALKSRVGSEFETKSTKCDLDSFW
jgi:hypothetical protein